MNKIIIPKKLEKGDTIAFVSPSAGLAPFAMHRIESAKKFFEESGYRVKIADHALENNGYVSSSIENRVNDINEMFRDKTVKAIICTIGGNHCNQLIKYLDYDLIRSNPKIFVGYSDITVLHHAIFSKTGLVTYYGPCVMTQFGENPKVFDYTWEYFSKVLLEDRDSVLIKPSREWTEELLNWFEKEDIKRERKLEKNTGHKWLKSGKAVGFLRGGCVPSINHLAGTEYWNDFEGSIFFIDIPEGEQFGKGLSISSLDSYLADLDNLGVFDKIAGLIVGRPFHYSAEENLELEKIIFKYTNNKNYPVLANVNVGHTDPIITLQYNSEITLDSEEDLFQVLG